MGTVDCEGIKRGWEITILVALWESGKEKISVTKQGQVFSLIKSLVGQANLLTIPRLFIDYTDDLESALLLSQKFESRKRSERIKAGLARAVKNGSKLGRPSGSKAKIRRKMY